MLDIPQICNSPIAIRATFVGDDVIYLWTSEKTINFGCTPRWHWHGLILRTSWGLFTFKERNTLSGWAIICNDVNYLQQALAHADRCAPRSFQNTINASTFVGDNMKHLRHAPTHPECSRSKTVMDVVLLSKYTATPSTWICNTCTAVHLWCKKQNMQHVKLHQRRR